MGAGYSMKANGPEAEVYIYEDVGAGWFGGVSAKQFAADLKALGKVDTIHLRINSYGGEVFDGVAIYNQLKEHSARVVTHIDGVAASIASVIAMAGDEILIAEAGFIMIHEALGAAYGFADDHRKLADLLDTITGTICDVYEARTEQDRDAIRDWMKEERWFTGAEAVEYLFADQVVENLRVAAHLNVSRHAFKHVPQALLSDQHERAALLLSAPGTILTAPPLVAEVPPPTTTERPRFTALSAQMNLQRAQLAAKALPRA